MPTYAARWILPIVAPPISDGVITIESDRIAYAGPMPEGEGLRPDDVIDLGPVAILPGLVNAHTHLELSWMGGLVPPAPRMTDWVRRLLQVRLEAGRDDPGAIASAIDAAQRCGTAVVGDVSNSLASHELLAQSRLQGVVFHELVGFAGDGASDVVAAARDRVDRLGDAPNIRVYLAPHAPYSVSVALFDAIHREMERSDGPCSIHVAESAEEIDLLSRGAGAWRDLLEELGAWNGTWAVPGCSPVDYLARLGFLTSNLLAVHGVHLNEVDLRQLARARATLVTCPRSNAWTGAGIPPVERFYSSGARVAVGTDSLASSPDLNIFAELAELRRIAPTIQAGTLLESATLAGAEALGTADRFGSLEPGKSAHVLAVVVPETVEDVEEYLIGGIEPAWIRWLDGLD